MARPIHKACCLMADGACHAHACPNRWTKCCGAADHSSLLEWNHGLGDHTSLMQWQGHVLTSISAKPCSLLSMELNKGRGRSALSMILWVHVSATGISVTSACSKPCGQVSVSSTLEYICANQRPNLPTTITAVLLKGARACGRLQAESWYCDCMLSCRVLGPSNPR
jgi:hypothetical protein